MRGERSGVARSALRSRTEIRRTRRAPDELGAASWVAATSSGVTRGAAFAVDRRTSWTTSPKPEGSMLAKSPGPIERRSSVGSIEGVRSLTRAGKGCVTGRGEPLVPLASSGRGFRGDSASSFVDVLVAASALGEGGFPRAAASDALLSAVNSSVEALFGGTSLRERGGAGRIRFGEAARLPEAVTWSGAKTFVTVCSERSSVGSFGGAGTRELGLRFMTDGEAATSRETREDVGGSAA